MTWVLRFSLVVKALLFLVVVFCDAIVVAQNIVKRTSHIVAVSLLFMPHSYSRFDSPIRSELVMPRTAAQG
jgi:hypothetical protein